MASPSASKVRAALARPVRRALGRLDLTVARKSPVIPPDIDRAHGEVIRRVGPYTLTTPERLHALCEAVRYIQAARVEGAVVECGVWRGGSMMAAALTLLDHGPPERDLYLFDTFAGMTEPTGHDVDGNGIPATRDFLPVGRGHLTTSHLLDPSPVDEVRANMGATGYPSDRTLLVAGRVEDTIPEQAPSTIALLRLDTDWYESTRHELEHLYPRLSPGGVLIIDDYGHWQGARRAVDEYLERTGARILLNRIDYTGRISVVPDRHPSPRDAANRKG